MSRARTAIIGVGNSLLQDEGIGMYMTQLIEDTYTFSTAIDFHYIGTGGLALADVLLPYEYVLLLDTIILDEVPGTLITLNHNQLLPKQQQSFFAGHAIGLHSALEFAVRLGTLPRKMSMVAMVPGQIKYGDTFSEAVQKAIPLYEIEILRVLQNHSIDSFLSTSGTLHTKNPGPPEDHYQRNTSKHFKEQIPE